MAMAQLPLPAMRVFTAFDIKDKARPQMIRVAGLSISLLRRGRAADKSLKIAAARRSSGTRLIVGALAGL